MCGFVKVKGKTLEEAINNFECDIDDIPLPASSSYVDGGFQLTSRDEGFIRLYNKEQVSEEAEGNKEEEQNE